MDDSAQVHPLLRAAGDGVAVSDESAVVFQASEAVSLLWFDMP